MPGFQAIRHFTLPCKSAYCFVTAYPDDFCAPILNAAMRLFLHAGEHKLLLPNSLCVHFILLKSAQIV